VRSAEVPPAGPEGLAASISGLRRVLAAGRGKMSSNLRFGR